MDSNKQQHSQAKQTTKSPDFVRCLGDFFKRSLISIPLIKKYPHQSVSQRCGLGAATLELDTAAYPSIEYVAGTRLSVYPVNPADHVQVVLKHVIDDVNPAGGTTQTTSATAAGKHPQRSANNQSNHSKASASTSVVNVPNWAKFAQANGKDSLRLALYHLFDITTAPSRDLIRALADCCANKEHRSKLTQIGKSDESWEKWICQSQRTLKGVFEEFTSCNVSAKVLLNELSLQQPRQYSISSIRSSKRFRAEIIVFQHRFSSQQIGSNLEHIKARERIEQAAATVAVPLAGQTRSPAAATGSPAELSGKSGRSSSIRSVRSVATFANSPITTHQVRRVPSYSGPLMSMYAASSSIDGNLVASALNGGGGRPGAEPSASLSLAGATGHSIAPEYANLLGPEAQVGNKLDKSSSSRKTYDGLCSHYLLNLSSGEHIVCEFVENPRFTLKGNRERPTMLIGQDVGVLAYRAFWQQRTLEHDRAQVFYTLFKDLSPKRFGEMQLVCLTGNKCKVEDLFRQEINSVCASRILSSVLYINREHLISLLEIATVKSQLTIAASKDSTIVASSSTASKQTTTAPSNAMMQQQAVAKKLAAVSSTGGQLRIESKELIDLGNRIYKLLIENNGCLYTCCDPHMTQAIEILLVESIARNNSTLTRDKIMSLLPKWKGKGRPNDPADGTKYVFKLENPFERAQIVQEIYDSSI